MNKKQIEFSADEFAESEFEMQLLKSYKKVIQNLCNDANEQEKYQIGLGARTINDFLIVEIYPTITRLKSSIEYPISPPPQNYPQEKLKYLEQRQRYYQHALNIFNDAKYYLESYRQELIDWASQKEPSPIEKIFKNSEYKALFLKILTDLNLLIDKKLIDRKTPSLVAVLLAFSDAGFIEIFNQKMSEIQRVISKISNELGIGIKPDTVKKCYSKPDDNPEPEVRKKAVELIQLYCLNEKTKR